ncbi:hypothetical protein GCM10020221_23620 [Streptomyces thioluteus]|uniref:Uncharacterized protein n=1 Tax=Streptomyces thioluteus TaxID=66431 RepID=A0ABN3WV21_STRTU
MERMNHGHAKALEDRSITVRGDRDARTTAKLTYQSYDHRPMAQHTLSRPWSDVDASADPAHLVTTTCGGAPVRRSTPPTNSASAPSCAPAPDSGSSTSAPGPARRRWR